MTGDGKTEDLERLGLTTTVGGGLRVTRHANERECFVLPPGYLNPEDTGYLRADPRDPAWSGAIFLPEPNRISAPLWSPPEQPERDPLAGLFSCAGPSPLLDAPLTPTLDENGVVVLRDPDGCARAWMSQAAYAGFYEYANGEPPPMLTGPERKTDEERHGDG